MDHHRKERLEQLGVQMLTIAPQLRDGHGFALLKAYADEWNGALKDAEYWGFGSGHAIGLEAGRREGWQAGFDQGRIPDPPPANEPAPERTPGPATVTPFRVLTDQTDQTH